MTKFPTSVAGNQDSPSGSPGISIELIAVRGDLLKSRTLQVNGQLKGQLKGLRQEFSLQENVTLTPVFFTIGNASTGAQAVNT